MTATVEKETAPDVVLAAGAVVWRDDPEEGLRVALVHRPRYDDWSLPKGKVDPGEHLLETAVREMREETGQRVRLGRPLGATSYLALGVPKRVHYWAAEALGGSFAPHEEIDEVRWEPLAEAAEMVDRDSDRAVLAEFLRRPVRTTPVVLLRHAKAMPRKEWSGDPVARPLHGDSGPQTQALVGMLAAYDVTTVVTSSAARCVQTVQPYLDSRPGEVEHRAEECLTEEGFAEDPAAAADVLHRLLEEGRRTLVCSHRPVLPALLGVLQQHSATPTSAAVVEAPLRTAEMVVAHLADSSAVAVERHRP